ncbi:MAG: hypothetical protein ACI8QT_001437 [Halioglobus sp.]|jgi:hypothetical protein
MRYFVLAALSLTLAGCQTSPPLVVPDCPVIESVSCPACEVQQCPTPAVVDKVITACEPVPPVQCETASAEQKYETIGEVEWAFVEPGELTLEARIDTGAETSSIHAEDIRLLEKDGKRWVQFALTDPTTKAKISLERRLHRRILVKQKASDVQDRRYVVRMWVTLGNNRTWLDVSLSDRDDFEFPLLLGRNVLMDNFVVDVSKHHTIPKPKPKPKAEGD